MDTKLTLKLNEAVIEKAKKYAAEKKLSLSKLIENYLNAVTIETKTTDNIEISAFVKSLSSGATLPADYNYKKDYWEHLEEKHK